jgi:hypothetical protein
MPTNRDSELITRVRNLLKLWDDGVIARGEFDALLDDVFRKPFFDALEKGETWRQFGSCCCSGHAPDRTFKVEITIEPHGFTAKRCE